MTSAIAPASASLLESARAVAPHIRAAGEEIDRGRQLPDPIVRAMAEAGLFRIQVPLQFGGAACDPPTYLRVLEEIARANGSAAWILMNAGDWGRDAAFLDEETAREIFEEDPLALVAGVGQSAGRAIEVEGGYRVTARWTRASGISHARWVHGQTTVYGGDGPRLLSNGRPDVRRMYFPIDTVEIFDTWHGTGLRGTCSHDFAVDDVYVPARRTLPSVFLGRTPRIADRLYAFPEIVYAMSDSGAVALGVAREAIDALVAIAGEARPMIGRGKRLCELPHAQMWVAQAEGAVRSGRAFYYEAVEALWDTVSHGREIALQQHALYRLAFVQAILNSIQAVDLMYNAGGASALYESHVLQRCFRDVHAIAQPGFAAPPVLERVGQAFLNLDPDNPKL